MEAHEVAKKYYWLKLKDNFFNQKEIKKLRKIAGGDTYTIIYLKMQLLSIKTNGVITFDGTESDLAEQLSLEIDEDIENIKITLVFLKSNNLIEEIDADTFLLPKVTECIGKEGASAERVRKHRERKALEQKQNVNLLQNSAEMLQCNTEVTKCNTEIEIEKEKDINNNIYADVINYLNFKAGKNFRPGTTKTKSLIDARIRESFTLEDFKTVIDVKCSSWLGTDYEKFLRPETLFSNKFEGYLNEKPKKATKPTTDKATVIVDDDYINKVEGF